MVCFLACLLQYKLCKVRRVQTGPKGVPLLYTHDGRTIRYPDPLIKVNDTVLLDIATSKIKDFIKFDSGMAYDYSSTIGFFSSAFILLYFFNLFAWLHILKTFSCFERLNNTFFASPKLGI